MSLKQEKAERRVQPRMPVEIRSLEDAHNLVEQVAKRDAANDPKVKAWQLAKQSTWLSLLVGAFLLFFLVSVIYEVINLSSGI
jgi:hypothetical protein